MTNMYKWRYFKYAAATAAGEGDEEAVPQERKKIPPYFWLTANHLRLKKESRNKDLLLI